MLSVETAVPFLIERGLLNAAQIVEHGVEVSELARRNLNLKVVPLRGNGRGLILKQPDLSEPSTSYTLGQEALFYELCESLALFPAHRANSLGFCPKEETLILELIADAVPFRTLHTSLSKPVGDAIGLALASIHTALRSPLVNSSAFVAQLPSEPPWILNLHCPSPEALPQLSYANRQAIRILQKEYRACDALDELRRSWAPSHIQHTDIKSDNLLVRHSIDGPPIVVVIDWELVQDGDAAWDIGSVFHDLLLLWIQSMPIAATSTAEQLAVSAAVPISQLQPTIQGFWSTYRSYLPSDIEKDLFLWRSVGFAGARLLQSAYEASSRSPILSNHAVTMIQVAVNMLADRERACLDLLGLSPTWILRKHATAAQGR